MEGNTDLDPRIEHTGEAPAEPEQRQKPLFGIAIVLFPNGSIAHQPLDPEASEVERHATYQEAITLCNLLLIHEQAGQLAKTMLQQKTGPILVPKNDGNPMMNGLRNWGKRLRG